MGHNKLLHLASARCGWCSEWAPRAFPPNFRPPRMSSIRLAAAAFTAVFAFMLPSSAVGGVDSTEALAIVKVYCAACHGGEKPKADLRLATADSEIAKQAEMWSTVLERLTDGTMPPEDKLQPTAEERRKLTDWIRSGLIEHQRQKALTNGRARI